MNTIQLTDEELEMARHAVAAYLTAFGHDEADMLAVIWRVHAKLEAAQSDGDGPQVVA